MSMVMPVGVCLVMNMGVFMRMRVKMRVEMENSFFRIIFLDLFGMDLLFMRRRIQMLFGHIDHHL